MSDIRLAKLTTPDLLDEAAEVLADDEVLMARGETVVRVSPSLVGPETSTSRAALVARVAAGYTQPDGAKESAAGLDYLWQTGGTLIDDLSFGGRGLVPSGEVTPDHFASNTTPGTTDMTDAIQAAIDWLAGRTVPHQGGTLHFGPTIYAAAGIELKDYVYLRGAGMLATVIQVPDGSNTHCIGVAESTAGNGVFDLTIDGNADGQGVGQTGCHGLFIKDTGNTGGDSFQPFGAKAMGDDVDAFKYFWLQNVAIGYCRTDGIYKGNYSFGCYFDNVYVAHCLRNGFRCGGTDSIYSNMYVSKNQEHGLLVTSGANKFSQIKSIWNGRTDNTKAAFRIDGPNNVFVNCEAQDNYCDGWQIAGNDNQIINAVSDTNGYLALGSEDESSEIHAGFTIDGAQRLFLTGRVFSYKSVVGSDGLWTTQYAYKILNSPTFQHFELTDDGKVNAVPSGQIQQTMYRGDYARFDTISNDGGDNVYTSLDSLVPNGTGNAFVRLFRTVSTTGNVRFDMHVPGSTLIEHRFTMGGDTQLHNQNDGNLIVGDGTTGGAWNTSHFRLGPHHLWVDSTGDLRIKSSAPTGDTDGTVVGAQS